MTKLAPEWVRTSDPVIRRPARYRWTTAPAVHSSGDHMPPAHSSGGHMPLAHSSEIPNAVQNHI